MNTLRLSIRYAVFKDLKITSLRAVRASLLLHGKMQYPFRCSEALAFRLSSSSISLNFLCGHGFVLFLSLLLLGGLGLLPLLGPHLFLAPFFDLHTTRIVLTFRRSHFACCCCSSASSGGGEFDFMPSFLL